MLEGNFLFNTCRSRGTQTILHFFSHAFSRDYYSSLDSERLWRKQWAGDRVAEDVSWVTVHSSSRKLASQAIRAWSHLLIVGGGLTKCWSRFPIGRVIYHSSLVDGASERGPPLFLVWCPATLIRNTITKNIYDLRVWYYLYVLDPQWYSTLHVQDMQEIGYKCATSSCQLSL